MWEFLPALVFVLALWYIDRIINCWVKVVEYGQGKQKRGYDHEDFRRRNGYYPDYYRNYPSTRYR